MNHYLSKDLCSILLHNNNGATQIILNFNTECYTLFCYLQQDTYLKDLGLFIFSLAQCENHKIRPMFNNTTETLVMLDCVSQPNYNRCHSSTTRVNNLQTAKPVVMLDHELHKGSMCHYLLMLSAGSGTYKDSIHSFNQMQPYNHKVHTDQGSHTIKMLNHLTIYGYPINWSYQQC